MFLYEAERLAIPQREHAKLAAEFARNWGNNRFKKPSIPRNVLVQGVLLHDNGYPDMDQSPIGQVSEEESLNLIQLNFNQVFEDKRVEAIVKFHNLRLASYSDSDVYSRTILTLSRHLKTFLEEHNLDRNLFEWVDRITDFCDSLSFDLSFGRHTHGSNSVYLGSKDLTQSRINYEINPVLRKILVSPWPFSSPEFTVALIGYLQEEYPATVPQKVELQFEVRSSIP